MITWWDHCWITMHIKQASSSSPVKEINFVPSAQAFLLFRYYGHYELFM
jgi:hypothetical protein